MFMKDAYTVLITESPGYQRMLYVIKNDVDFKEFMKLTLIILSKQRNMSLKQYISSFEHVICN